MTRTALALGEPPDAMPIWARLQLADLGHRFVNVTHWIGSSDGRSIAAAVLGEPVYLIRK